MTITDSPNLPPELALGGEPEPVSDAALDWLADRIHDEPEWSLDRVIESAAVEAAEPVNAGEGLEVLTRWEIDGTGSAEWAMRKLAAVEAEGNEVAEQAEAWISEIERWRDQRMHPLEARSAFFTEHLTRWLRKLREADPAKKSVTLPSGAIRSRTVPPKIEVVGVEGDLSPIADWAWDNLSTDEAEAVVQVSMKIMVSELKRHVVVDTEALVVRDRATGQPIEGLAVEPGGVSYSVKVGG